MNGWTFLFFMLVLKVPVAAAFALVWWAVKHAPDSMQEDQGGGTSKPSDPHPRGPLPLPARRGPHGDAQTPAPKRVRSGKRKIEVKA